MKTKIKTIFVLVLTMLSFAGCGDVPLFAVGQQDAAGNLIYAKPAWAKWPYEGENKTPIEFYTKPCFSEPAPFGVTKTECEELPVQY